MELIILLIIIFFVWRHFKKKKANQAESQAEYQAGTPQVLKLPSRRGKPVTQADLPKDFKEQSFEARFGGNPDLAFACAKHLYDEDVKKLDGCGISIGNDEGMNSLASRIIVIGSRLMEYYRDGYGCEPDPAAAIKISEKLTKHWGRMWPVIRKQKQSDAELQVVQDLISDMDDVYLCTADCLAMLGQNGQADAAYRAAFKQAGSSANPTYRMCSVMDHALGDYHLYGDTRPMRWAVASELALGMVGNNIPMGGRYLKAITQMRNARLDELGQSLEKDYQIFSQAQGFYALYRTGRACLYGLGTTQDVQKGVSMLEQAYEQGSAKAAECLYKYYDQMRENAYSTDKKLYKQAQMLANEWSSKYERLKANDDALIQIKNTNAADEEIAEYGEKYAVTELEETEAVSEGAQGGAASAAGADEFSLSGIPFIVYDDSNRQWKRRGIYGDHAVYYNNDGEEVTIYSAQVSGNSATTSAGTLHWY